MEIENTLGELRLAFLLRKQRFSHWYLELAIQIHSLVSLEVNVIMSHFFEALNKPRNAYRKQYKGIATLPDWWTECT